MIGSVAFALYAFDNGKMRIGEGQINLTNVAAGESVKFQMTVFAVGTPDHLSVTTAAPRAVAMTVNSVPQGAALTVDGKSAGTTPKIVELAVGKHLLGFEKDGFSPGKFPLEITARDASGGSVSYELGSATHDSIELRDGSVLAGDLISINGMDVLVRIGGSAQRLDRNQVKRILLAERAPATD